MAVKGEKTTQGEQEFKVAKLRDRRRVEVIMPKGSSFPLFTLAFGFADYTEKAIERLQRGYERAGEVLDEILAENGLFGEHQLLAGINVERGSWGSVHGEWAMNGFLFVIRGGGKLDGEMRTASSVQFAWEPKEGEIVISEVPVDKLVIRVNPEIKVPTVFFNVEEASVIVKPGVVDQRNENWWEELTSSGRSVLYYDVLDLPHVNDYLRDERLESVILTVDSEERLQGLPL